MMRLSRLLILVLIFSLGVGSWVFAQEATEEPAPESTEDAPVEVTEEATPEPEVTEEPTDVPPGEPTAQPTDIPTSGGSTYTVRAGDTLYRIAVNNNTTVAVLAQLNNITNPALIYTGQVLILPSGNNQPTVPTPTPDPEATEEPDDDPGTPPSGETYIIQPGDTLFRIASRFNTTVTTLQNLNNIANINLIFAGQRLILPGEDGDETDTDEGSASEPSADADFGYGLQVYMNVSNTAAIASQIEQLGVDWVKIDVSWAELEPLENEFDYADLDATIAALDEVGVNILLNVYEAPAWTRTEYTLNQLLQLNSGPPYDLATFDNFMRNLATRYAGVVDAYEIWKSPNLLKYWTVPVYRTEPERQENGDYGVPDEIAIGAIYYVDLLAIGSTSVRAVDPDALIITAGLAPVGSSDNYNFIATGTFLNNMLQAGAANYSDAIGAIFGASAVPPTALCCDQPPGVDSHYESFLQYLIEILEFYNDIMQRNNVGNMPLFVTQFGWGTTEGGIISDPPGGFEWLNYTSLEEQGLYISQAYDIGENLNYVAGMFLSNLNGCSVGDAEACFFSLIDSNNIARPAFGVLQELDKSN